MVIYIENLEALRGGDVDDYQTKSGTFPGKQSPHKGLRALKCTPMRQTIGLNVGTMDTPEVQTRALVVDEPDRSRGGCRSQI